MPGSESHDQQEQTLLLVVQGDGGLIHSFGEELAYQEETIFFLSTIGNLFFFVKADLFIKPV